MMKQQIWFRKIGFAAAHALPIRPALREDGTGAFPKYN